MKDYKNEGGIDRLARVLIAEVLLMSGYLWLSGVWQMAAYAVGAISLITAVTGFCGVYKMFGANTRGNDEQRASGAAKSVFVIILLIIAAVGIYYANF